MRILRRQAPALYLALVALLCLPTIEHVSVLCIGTDGHVAVETGRGRCADDPAVQADRPGQGPEVGTTADGCGPCVDLPMPPTLLVPARHDAGSVNLASAAASVVASASSWTREPTPRLTTRFLHATSLPSSARPTRTTILRN